LKVVAKAIVQLKFYSGSSMCPATVWIVSGLRSRRTNDTAPALAAELFFSWTWLRLRGSRFSWLWFRLQLGLPFVFTHLYINCLGVPEDEWKM